MGYGFSLPDNPADHFSIGFSPAIAAYIKVVRESRFVQNHKSEMEVEGNSSQGEMDESAIHWVRIHEGKPEFSPCFLEDLSIATENPRESRSADIPSQLGSNFSNVPHSRNRLHMLCALLTIIRKGQASIRKYDRDLPEQPQNARQLDAARYRQSQLYILDHVLQSLNTILRPLINRTIPWCENFRIARLENVLAESPKRLQKDLRGVLNAGLRTRDPSKIRERGGTDFAFTVWLFGLLVCYRQDITYGQAALSEFPFHEYYLRWLSFLHDAYPSEEIRNSDPACYSNSVLEADRAAWFDPVRKSVFEEDNTPDTATIAASYLDAIHIHIDKHPKSLYNVPERNTTHLTWCYSVVRNEGVWVPNLQDTEGDDEWMLCLECRER